MRSFMLPVGFSPSTLTKIRAQPSGTILRNSTSDVLPIVSRTDGPRIMEIIPLMRLLAHGACLYARLRDANHDCVGGRWAWSPSDEDGALSIPMQAGNLPDGH